MNTDKRRIQEEENHSIADDSSNSTVEGKKFEEIFTVVEKLPKKKREHDFWRQNLNISGLLLKMYNSLKSK